MILLVVCVVVASASPGMAQCTGRIDSSQDLTAKMQMYSYMTAGIAQAQGGSLSAADQTWRAAYDYWTKYCYPDAPNWVNHVVRLIRGGKVQEAFQTFPGIVAPMYSDAGADTSYKNGLNAGQRGEFKIAADEFRNAIQIVSKYSGKSCCPDADFMLGMALYGQGKRADATRQWRLTLSDSYPAVPEPEASGPDGFWLSALQLYATQRVPPLILGYRAAAIASLYGRFVLAQ